MQLCNKPVILVINKIDELKRSNNTLSDLELKWKELLPLACTHAVSALHGTNIDSMMDAVLVRACLDSVWAHVSYTTIHAYEYCSRNCVCIFSYIVS
jgi:predicted GTPase